MADHMITVEVAHADEEGQVVCELQLPRGSTVAEAIKAYSTADMFPNGRPMGDVGIFGRKVALNLVLADGDRVEIYRPLQFNPMEARRRRVR